MRKTYQNEEIDTSRPAVLETVSVALAELVEDDVGGPAGPGGRDGAAGDVRDYGGGCDRGVQPARQA